MVTGPVYSPVSDLVGGYFSYSYGVGVGVGVVLGRGMTGGWGRDVAPNSQSVWPRAGSWDVYVVGF